MEDLLLIPVRKEGLISRKEREGFLFYNPDTDQLHILDPKGKELLDLCDGKNTVLNIIRICEEQKLLVGSNTIPSVVGFFDRLSARSLIGYK